MAAKDKILQRMNELGYSQRDLAKVSGVSHAAVSKIINGISSPSEETLRMIAKGLSIDPSWLISDESLISNDSESLKNRASALLSSMSDDEIKEVIKYMNYRIASREEGEQNGSKG